jgi:hypothetical protein
MAVAAQSDPAASPVANVAVANVGQVGVFKSRSPGVPATSWLVVWNMNFIFHILGMSSQLTHIFQRGRYTTKQLDYFIIVHSFFAFFRHIFLPNSWGPSFAVQYPQVSKNLSEEGNEVMRPVPVRSIKKVVRTSTRVVHTGAGKRERWGYEILMLQVYMT